MRVYISCDLEGISGVVHGDQTSSEGKDYQKARELMTDEVNAAIAGAYDAGADYVVVNDAHGSMRNIILDRLDRRAELISGSVKPLSMVEGIEKGFDAVFFIGYHAGMTARASVLAHTYYGQVVAEAMVNGMVVNEAILNAMVAGYYNVPVVLISGDDRTCEETKNILGEIETVIVKKGISRYAACCLHPLRAQELIKEASIKALRELRKYKPFKPPGPYTLVLKMLNTGMADCAEIMPGAKRVESNAVEYTAQDIITLYKAFRTLIHLGSAVVDVRK